MTRVIFRLPRRTLLTLASSAMVAALGGAALLVPSAACGPSGFASSTVVDSVRILATRVDGDKAYARPGDTVTLETLMVDGRQTKSPPAVLYWIPYVCTNPSDDLYYACFASLIGQDAGSGPSVDAGARGDAGATDASAGATGDGGGGAGDAGPPLSLTIPPGALANAFVPGTDLTPYLPTGAYTFKVPAGIITSHPAVSGTDPYGLVILFNIACAGRVMVPPTNAQGGPQQIPLGCFDDAGNALGPDQYVIGFTRVYVSLTKTDPNPVIAGFLVNGVETTTGDGGTALPGAVNVTLPGCSGDCSGVPIDMDVPTSSWTPSPRAIWVDYYALRGSLGADARLLYDQSAGKITNTVNPVTYSLGDDAGAATLWAVVHDSNDGVSWLQVNVAPK